MDKFLTFLKTITPISSKEYDEAITLFTTQKLKKGEYFAQQDKVCRHIGFINSGTLRVYYLNDKGDEITSCFCSENHMTTSYKSFILQQPSSLVLQAIEPTELLVINFDNLQTLYATSAVWQTIGRALAEREYISMEQYASVLNNDTAKQKYLRLLAEQPEVLQKANIEDIASYLGVTRRTLSRIRKEISNS